MLPKKCQRMPKTFLVIFDIYLIIFVCSTAKDMHCSALWSSTLGVEQKQIPMIHAIEPELTICQIICQWCQCECNVFDMCAMWFQYVSAWCSLGRWSTSQSEKRLRWLRWFEPFQPLYMLLKFTASRGSSTRSMDGLDLEDCGSTPWPKLKPCKFSKQWVQWVQFLMWLATAYILSVDLLDSILRTATGKKKCADSTKAIFLCSSLLCWIARLSKKGSITVEGVCSMSATPQPSELPLGLPAAQCFCSLGWGPES